MGQRILSIIIPTYNEEKDICTCLNSLKKQSFKDFEIIIVDDGSTDRTKEFVRKFKGVRVIEGKHKGSAFSRNLGAKQAKGSILIFVDADMTFDKNYLKNLVRPLLKDNKIIGTTHDYEIVKNMDNIWSKCWGKVRVSKKESEKVKIFRAIKKDKFLELGGFDPKYGYADDQTLWIKHRVGPIVSENTTCYHKNPETLEEIYKQSRWIGASINNPLFETPLLKYFSPFLLFLISPIAIPILSIKKIYKLKNFKIILPMLVFMSARYFGSISGISRKIYLNKNYR